VVQPLKDLEDLAHWICCSGDSCVLNLSDLPQAVNVNKRRYSHIGNRYQNYYISVVFLIHSSQYLKGVVLFTLLLHEEVKASMLHICSVVTWWLKKGRAGFDPMFLNCSSTFWHHVACIGAQASFEPLHCFIPFSSCLPSGIAQTSILESMSYFLKLGTRIILSESPYNSQSSVSTGFVSTNSNNHGLKILGKQLSVLSMYRLFLSLFPKQYRITSILH
jgi:hypothetical protein